MPIYYRIRCIIRTLISLCVCVYLTHPYLHGFVWELGVNICWCGCMWLHKRGGRGVTINKGNPSYLVLCLIIPERLFFCFLFGLFLVFWLFWAWIRIPGASSYWWEWGWGAVGKEAPPTFLSLSLHRTSHATGRRICADLCEGS